MLKMSIYFTSFPFIPTLCKKKSLTEMQSKALHVTIENVAHNFYKIFIKFRVREQGQKIKK